MKLQTRTTSYLSDDMIAWRRKIHTHPELGFEEFRTADFIAEKLETFGLEVHRGLASTGVVGTLRNGQPERAIALRADIDALPMAEQTGLPYQSQNEGRMHACGHDGHTTMLLGAARYLSEHPEFDGSVYFIFQPAEEGGGGGDVMVREGLFERFPAQAVYGMHNEPGLPVGQFAIRSGSMMASADFFELTVTGTGSHAAMPHLGHDPIVAASQLVGALQSIPSRCITPTDPVVLSVTRFHGGSADNVIPDNVVLGGTVRTLSEKARGMMETAIRQIADGVCRATGTRFELDYRIGFPVTVNHPDETEIAANVAGALVGYEHVIRNMPPSMGAEDFAFMLNACPGAYICIGNGSTDGGRTLHSPYYDFNDEILPLGAAYWVALVNKCLASDA